MTRRKDMQFQIRDLTAKVKHLEALIDAKNCYAYILNENNRELKEENRRLKEELKSMHEEKNITNKTLEKIMGMYNSSESVRKKVLEENSVLSKELGYYKELEDGEELYKIAKGA